MVDIQLKADKIELEKLRKLFGEFYDEDSKKKVIYKAPDPEYPTVEEYVDHLYEIGMPKTSVKEMGLILEQNYENLTKSPEYSETTTEAPQYTAPTTTVSPNLKEFVEELEQKEAARQVIINKNEEEVRASIKRQQEIYAEQAVKIKAAEAKIKESIYYKVEKPQVETTQEIKDSQTQAQADPKKFIEDATSQFEKSAVVQNLSPEEAKISATQAAITTYEVLTDNSPIIQAAVINEIVNSPELLGKIAPDPETQTIFKDAALDLADQKIAQFELSKQFAELNKIDGISGIENVKIILSPTYQDGFQELKLKEQITTPAAENFSQQSGLFDNLKGLREGEIKSRILSNVGIRLESQIAKLPANSLLAKAYQSDLGQFGLQSLGIVRAVPVTAVEGSLVGKALVGSGLGNAASFIQAKTGFKLGVIAAKTGAKAITKTAASTVVKTGFKAGFSKITAAIGSVVPGLGTLAGWIAGEVLVKIAEKIPWHKLKKISGLVVGSIAGLTALPFVGIGTAVGIGLGTTALAAGLGAGIGGLTLGGIGAGIGSFFGALAKITLGAIGKPILVTFLVFPVVVALILFIINSGAYVVPPGQSLLNSTNPYIDVSKVANPTGPLSSPQSITYTITVAAKKTPLTGIEFKNTCKSIGKNGATIDCKDLEEIPDAPETIIPGSPFSFTFTSDYDNKYQDSLVTDTFTVSAVAGEGGKVSETGSASICFGDCPLDCFNLDDSSWNTQSNLRSNLSSAAVTLAGQYPNFAAKVCASGTVKLCYTTTSPSPMGDGGLCVGNIYARHDHNPNCDIVFNQCGIKSQSDALYMLTHEATHHIQNINGALERKFEEQVPQPSWPICTYSSTTNPFESMAEAAALFVGKPSWNGCVTNFASQYPKHYQFAKNVMFAP